MVLHFFFQLRFFRKSTQHVELNLRDALAQIVIQQHQPTTTALHWCPYLPASFNVWLRASPVKDRFGNVEHSVNSAPLSRWRAVYLCTRERVSVGRKWPLICPLGNLYQIINTMKTKQRVVWYLICMVHVHSVVGLACWSFIAGSIAGRAGVGACTGTGAGAGAAGVGAIVGVIIGIVAVGATGTGAGVGFAGAATSIRVSNCW